MPSENQAFLSCSSVRPLSLSPLSLSKIKKNSDLGFGLWGFSIERLSSEEFDLFAFCDSWNRDFWILCRQLLKGKLRSRVFVRGSDDNHMFRSSGKTMKWASLLKDIKEKVGLSQSSPSSSPSSTSASVESSPSDRHAFVPSPSRFVSCSPRFLFILFYFIFWFFLQNVNWVELICRWERRVFVCIGRFFQKSGK